MTENITTIIAQLILGFIAVMIVYFAGIGNGWEIVAMPIGCTVAALVGGLLTGRALTTRVAIGTLVGSGLVAALLLIPIAWGFAGVLLPIVGAILGFHVAS